tara:strand:- start:601 stop:810 length:210 start_codon:yes stop_codon:yes gene_type:complete
MIQKISGYSDNRKDYAILYKGFFSFANRFFYFTLWIRPQIMFSWAISENINKGNIYKRPKIIFGGGYKL